MPTVQEFADAIGCSTADLRPLNDQILEILLDRVNTEEETSLVPCDDIPLLLVAGASTIPLLQPAARDSLQHVIEIKDRQLHLKHAFRTVAQQFVLREWVGNCGITSARRPGTSDHERGLAIDIDDNATWRSTLIANGWHWAGPGDKGHFNFIGDDINPNVLKESVRSFQILWNRNNPDDLIEEDGIYGDIETGPRLRISPIEGFPIVEV
jgi:N-acetylmuramoyl-L-alanine amidase